MQHTIAAVFDNRNAAQQAMDDLLASGFLRQDMQLTEAASGAGSAGDLSGNEDDSGGFSFKHFFSNLFGADDDRHTQAYSDAVDRGHYVLTLTAGEESEVERAADIVERYGPVDIDEQSSSAASTGQGSLLGGAGAQQQAAPMAQQYQDTRQGQPLSETQASQGPIQGGAQGAQQFTQDSDGTTIPVIQEELKVGKREVQRGGVRIFQRVVETPVNQSIGLREEHVSVDRRPVDRPLDPSDLGAFQESSFELRETAEEAVVEKSARVVEEVIVGKEVSQREQQISDSVRRTEVDIEQLSGSAGADHDAYFRSDWTTNYASAGGTYDDYAPAYRYGASMAGSDQYGGRDWSDVEPELQRGWESRNPDSAWEKFKSAVRHGWDRITS